MASRNLPRPSNQSVRFLGPVRFRRIPVAHLDDIAADAKLALERDLRLVPAPVSGGMRKALAKERAAQDALRYRPRRIFREADLRRAYGLLAASCSHCRHVMYFDAIEDFNAVICDRCKRPI